MTHRNEHFRKTTSDNPRELLTYFLKNFDHGKTWIELGPGAGNDSVFLLRNGYIVTAIDKEISAKENIISRISNSESQNFIFQEQLLGGIKLSPIDVIYSAFTLPFCKIEFFHHMMNEIKTNIKNHGYFVGNLFGENDDRTHLTLLSLEDIKNIFQGFDILYINEKQEKKGTATDPHTIKYRHIIDIIAQKNNNKITLSNTLTSEGFPIVYERYDEPGVVYERHCHQDKVSFYVTQGSVTFTFDDGTKKTVSSGERFDVPPQIYHTAIVGEKGCNYIVGQMVENDA